MEINIQKKSSQCLRCSTEFRHDEKHHSLLRIEGNDFLREDYCLACWPERSTKDGEDQLYSCWETRYIDPSVAKATPQEQFLPLLNLCYESIAEGGTDGEAMAYMCALILRRLREEARRRGFARVELETTASWDEVVAFYERNGLRLTHYRESEFGPEAHFAMDLG